MDMHSPSTPTQKAQMAYLQEYVGVPRSFVKTNIPPRQYSSYVALMSSTCERTNWFEEVQCDALVEECDGWLIIPFQKIVVDVNPIAGSNLQMASFVELQRELMSVGENSLLIKRECQLSRLL